MNNLIRIRRLQGSTILAQSGTKAQLFAHILNHYLNNGFTYMGKRISIDELTNITFIPESDIQQAIINSSGVYSRLFNPESIQDTMRVLFGRAFSGALGDRARILQFADKLEGHLADSQSVGNTLKVGYLYQKTLETVLKSNVAFTQILTQILPKGPQLNLILGFETDPNKAQDSQAYMGREEALQLISSGNPNPLHLTGKDSPVALALYEAHQLGDIESIIANPTDDGEVLMGNLPKASEILLNNLYDEAGELLE